MSQVAGPAPSARACTRCAAGRRRGRQGGASRQLSRFFSFASRSNFWMVRSSTAPCGLEHNPAPGCESDWGRRPEGGSDASRRVGSRSAFGADPRREEKDLAADGGFPRVDVADKHQVDVLPAVGFGLGVGHT